jgi:hypothetical protein
METIILQDPRVSYAKKLINAVFGVSTALKEMVVYLDDDHILAIVYNTAIYWFESNKKYQVGKPICFNYTESSDNIPEDSYIYDRYLLDKTYPIFCKYFGYLNTLELVAHQDHLESAECFEKYKSIKSADGAKFYRMPSIKDPSKVFLIPIMTKFPHLASKDQLYIDVYNIDENYLMVKFIIYKKKINGTYMLLFRTLKLT